MNIETKNILELLGGATLILSILFVGYELRQSNTIAVREARSEITNIYYDLSRMALEEPEIASLRVKLKSAVPELTPDEREQALGLAGLYNSAWAMVNSSVDANFLSEGLVDVYVESARQLFREYPGLAPLVKERLGERITPGVFPFYDVILEEIERASARQ